jgi:glucose-1-phosphate cytidylyltransferase
MQVVILCGGLGTRLRDIAEQLPKPMVPIGQRPILWHIMKGLATQGLREFILCLGYQSWIIKRYFLDYHLAQADLRIDLSRPDAVRLCEADPAEDWTVTLAETGYDAQTGCRVKRIEKYLTGERFLLTYGDGVADVDVQALIRFHQSHGRLATVTAVRPPGRFGEIDLDGGRVVSFNEKPTVSRGRINGGFMILQRAVLDRLRDDPALVLEQEPLMQLARDGELMAYEHDGFWHPMDTSRDYRILNDLWNTGHAPWRIWPEPPATPTAAPATATLAAAVAAPATATLAGPAPATVAAPVPGPATVAAPESDDPWPRKPR